MYKKLIITFEGIEGSGKSYQSKKLYKSIKKKDYLQFSLENQGGQEALKK